MSEKKFLDYVINLAGIYEEISEELKESEANMFYYVTKNNKAFLDSLSYSKFKEKGCISERLDARR